MIKVYEKPRGRASRTRTASILIIKSLLEGWSSATEEKDVFDVLGLDYKEPHERNVSDNATEVAEKARRLFEEQRRGGVEVDSSDDEEDARPAGRFRL